MGVTTAPDDVGFRRYGRLMRLPEAGQLLGSSVVARLPMWVITVSLIIFVADRMGSYVRAGLVVGAYNVAVAVAAPLSGRLADRYGHRRVLVVTSLAYGLLFGGFIAVAYAAPHNLPLLMAVAALAACAVPPLNACIRVSWGRATDDVTRPAAYALDQVVTEVMAVGARLLTAALLLALSAGYIVAGCVVTGTIGTLWLARLRIVGIRPQSPGRVRLWGWGAVAYPGVRALIVATVGIGFAFGTLTLTVLAFAEAHGSAYQAPLAMAFFSGAGVAGGIWYGGRRTPVDVTGRFGLLTAWFGAGILATAAAPGIVALCVLLILPGLVVPPTMSTAQLLADAVAGPEVLTETRAWIATALSTGVAAGSAVSGTLVTYADWRFAMLAAAVAVTGSGVVMRLSRRWVRGPEPAEDA